MKWTSFFRFSDVFPTRPSFWSIWRIFPVFSSAGSGRSLRIDFYCPQVFGFFFFPCFIFDLLSSNTKKQLGRPSSSVFFFCSVVDEGFFANFQHHAVHSERWFVPGDFSARFVGAPCAWRGINASGVMLRSSLGIIFGRFTQCMLLHKGCEVEKLPSFRITS